MLGAVDYIFNLLCAFNCLQPMKKFVFSVASRATGRLQIKPSGSGDENEYTTAIVSITACLAHASKKCTQSVNFPFDIKSPSDFKILSARKLKTLFQKYKLELTTGIHACIGHASCVNTREFLKDTTTADSHENVAWKSEFIFFSCSILILAYFVKCKLTFLELNFYQSYPSS